METSIEEVLQIDNVFTNVSKGMLASGKDLQESFGTTDKLLVCKEILDKGELQVSEQERAALLESMFRDVASIVTDKTINPENNRPYTISMIQNAMKQIHFSVNLTKSAKSQALDVIRKLKDVMSIARANMVIRLTYSTSIDGLLRDSFMSVLSIQLPTASSKPENEVSGATTTAATTTTAIAADSEISMDLVIDPEHFKKVEEIAHSLHHSSNNNNNSHSKSNATCRVEVLQVRVTSAATAVPIHNTNSKQQSDGVDHHDSEVGGEHKEDHTNEQSIARAEHTDESEEEILASKHSKKSKQKKDKAGRLKAQILAATKSQEPSSKASNNEESLDVSDIVIQNASDAEEEEDDNNDDVVQHVLETLQLQHSEKKSPKEELKATGTGGSKKGKTTKRIEKEEKKERELRAEKLKERLERDTKQSGIKQASAAAEEIAKAGPGDVASGSNSSTSASTTTVGAEGGKCCNTCGGNFLNATDYRNHFRSEWHRFNLNRKLKGLSIVGSEAEFAAMSLEEIEKC